MQSVERDRVEITVASSNQPSLEEGPKDASTDLSAEQRDLSEILDALPTAPPALRVRMSDGSMVWDTFPVIESAVQTELDAPEYLKWHAGGICVISDGPCDKLPVLTDIQYPRWEGTALEADCDVWFSVSAEGKAYDLDAICTHPAFKRVAERAVAKVMFATDDQCGPCPYNGVRRVYPIEFRLSD